MRSKRIFLLLPAFLLIGATQKQVTTKNGATGGGITVTNTAATTNLDASDTGAVPFKSVTVFNCNLDLQGQTLCSSTSKTIYVRVFQCGATLVASTVSTGSDGNQGMPIAATQSVTFNWAPEDGDPGLPQGFCRLSALTASSTALMTVISK